MSAAGQISKLGTREVLAMVVRDAPVAGARLRPSGRFHRAACISSRTASSTRIMCFCTVTQPARSECSSKAKSGHHDEPSRVTTMNYHVSPL
eukprot:4875063-Prymnesium_polylepis.1